MHSAKSLDSIEKMIKKDHIGQIKYQCQKGQRQRKLRENGRNEREITAPRIFKCVLPDSKNDMNFQDKIVTLFSAQSCLPFDCGLGLGGALEVTESHLWVCLQWCFLETIRSLWL